jgi:tetratricopeptide (TPR) repeat protein
VELAPDRAEVHYLLGSILANMAMRAAGLENVMEEAKKCLSRALEIDPRHAPARAYLMGVSFHEGKYDECLQMAEGALRENPQDRLALSFSGRCFLAEGAMAQAVERLVKLVELYPDDREGRGELAEVYRAQNRFKEAAEELEQAVAVPGRRPPPDLLFRLGEIYLTDLNEPAKARAYFFRFLQAAPPGHPDYDLAKKLLGGVGLGDL